MPELSRSQVVVYGAIAIALLLVGVRAIRAEGDSGPSASPAGPAASANLSIGHGGPDVVVDVAGAVRRPGVYRLPAGARVIDALQRAGGTEAGAALESINRAARLADGQQVVVPQKGPEGPRPRRLRPKRGRSASAAPRSSSSRRSTGSAR